MNYLKYTMNRFNLNQLDIVRFCGITQSRVSRIVNLTAAQFEDKVSIKELKRFTELASIFEGNSEVKPDDYFNALYSNENYESIKHFNL